MAPILIIMHQLGYRLLRYLADWLLIASSKEDIFRARHFIKPTRAVGDLNILYQESLGFHTDCDVPWNEDSFSSFEGFPTQENLFKLSQQL